MWIKKMSKTWTLFTVILGYCTTALVADEESISCDEGWHQLHRGCYQFVTEMKSWSDADAHCKSSQSQLASIQSIKEKAAIAAYLASEHRGARQWWAGFYRKESKGADWRWLSDDGVVYDNLIRWSNPKMKRRPGAVCGLVENKSRLTLANTRCSTKRPFICEYHSISARRSTTPSVPAAKETQPTSTTTLQPEKAFVTEIVKEPTKTVISVESGGERSISNGSDRELEEMTPSQPIDKVSEKLLLASASCNGFGATEEDAALYRVYLQNAAKAEKAKTRYYAEVSRMYAEALEYQKRYYATYQEKLDLELSNLKQSVQSNCNNL